MVWGIPPGEQIDSVAVFTLENPSAILRDRVGVWHFSGYESPVSIIPYAFAMGALLAAVSKSFRI